MKLDSRIPTSLKIVAGLFFLAGASSLIQIIASLTKGEISLNFGVLALFVGYGLLQLKKGWWTVALFLLWIAFLGSTAFTLMLAFSQAPLSVNMFGEKVGHAPKIYGFAVILVIFLVALWQYRVLTKQEIKELFEKKAS